MIYEAATQGGVLKDRHSDDWFLTGECSPRKKVIRFDCLLGLQPFEKDLPIRCENDGNKKNLTTLYSQRKINYAKIARQIRII